MCCFVSLTRRYVVQLSCHFGLPECVTQAQQLFEGWMDNPDVNTYVIIYVI